MRCQTLAIAAVLPIFSIGCTDTATFVTGTDIGIAASTNTQQVQIGYSRVELFQGPGYPDVGDAPQVVGFISSDLKIFAPHIRQLYATGDAANFVTTPEVLGECPSPAPNLCNETSDGLAGERRALVFSTGTNFGLKLGFTATAPSTIKFGYDREEISIIPLQKDPPALDGKTADKYASVLASIDLNSSATNSSGSEVQMTQFFATGAAARNLAKNPVIQAYFKATAQDSVDKTLVSESKTITDQSQKAIDAYFSANKSGNFVDVRDKLLKDNALAQDYASFPPALKSAATAAAFDAAMRGEFVVPIGAVAKRLTPSAAAPS
jgi:hypothetical protein